jgi:hypothetical protein
MTIQLIIDSKFNSAGVREAEKQVSDLVKNIETQFRSQGSSAFLENQLGTITDGTKAIIQERIVQAEQLAAAYKNAAVQQYSLGNNTVAEALNKEAQALERTANSMRDLTAATQDQNQEQQKSGGVLDFINNSFNKFAFSLFVVRGAINTITSAIGQMTDALIEGASIADRSAAFNVLLEDAGVNAEALRASLIGASQGAITLDAAMRPTLQLMKANVPEIAGMSDELLKIAVASAKLSGDLSQTEQIYTTLVRGIVRGSPRLIDNADIYLKLGDAVESYAASIGKSVEELTPEDKIRATAYAVTEQGQAIVELADQVNSTAITFQNFKTDAEEAGQALLAAVSTGAASAITWFTDLMLTMGDATAAMWGFSEDSQVALRDFREAFAENPFSTFVQSVLVGGTALVEFFRFLITVTYELGEAFVKTFSFAGHVIGLFFQIQSGAISAAEGMESLRQASIDWAETMRDGLDASEEWNDGMDRVNDRAREAAVNLGLVSPEMDNIGSSADAAAAQNDRLAASFDQLSAGIQASIEARTGLDAQYRDRKVDIEEDLRDKVVDINEDLAERLNDISSGLQDKLLDLNSKYQEDLAKLAEETAEKLQDIDEDLAEKLNDISEGSGENREEAIKNRNKSIEDAHEDHQRKLRDIERKYEAARMKALIDRDARALFEAEQNRKTERDEANEDLQDKIKDEEEELAEQLEKINELEEKRRQEAIEAAEKRRQDAIEAQQKKLDDLKKALDKEREEARKNADKQRQDAMESASERRRDAQEHYRDSLLDLDEWYKEQLIRQKEANLQQKLNELEHLAEMGELTQAHLDELRGMWNDYNGFVAGNTGAVPGGGSIGGFAPGGGSSGGGGGSIGGFAPSSAAPAPSLGQMQNMKLQINSNDRMLEDVLRSSTYDYMLEAIP